MAGNRRQSVSVPPSVEVHDDNYYPTNHLFVLTPTNPFRKACVAISTSKAFDSFIMLAIAVNCIMMAMNAPLPNDDKSNLGNTLESFEVYLLGIFCSEAFFKIVSQGFLLHENAYLRNSWNILDFVVVVTGILPYVGMNSGGPTKVIKAARVLRPLKLVSGIPSLQVVMSAILKSMASLLQICLLIGFVIVIYAIMGLSFFIDLFHLTCFYTSNNTIWQDGYLCGKSDSAGRQCPDGTECKEYWLGPNTGITNFDNIILGCITVFTCITCEGWTDVMYWAFQVYDYKGRFIWLYFYSLNVIGSQFMLNLVCGVLSGEFSKENERVANREEFLRQRAESVAERAVEKYEGWVDEGELAAAKELEEKLKKQEELEDQGEVIEPPLNGLQSFLLKNAAVRVKLKAIMLSNFMYWLVIGLVFLNSASGIIQHYKQPQLIDDIINISDNVFLGFFFIEMCLKIYALGPALYFESKFNLFDSVVVFMSIINWLLNKYGGINLGVSVLRQLRLMRLFKFTMYWPSLKNLIRSILASMTSIMSLLLLLALFLMIFALLGMQLFGGHLNITNPRSNFDDFFNAILTVFQIITGEDWNNAMYEGINAYGGPKSASGIGAGLYFIVVTCLGNYVLLNVFLAIAVDNISLTADEKQQVAEEESAREDHMKEVHEEYAPADEADKDQEYTEYDLESAHVIGEFDTFTPGGAKPGDNFLENLKNPSRMIGLPQPYKPPIMEQNTLFICVPTNPVRKIVHIIVSSPYFDNILLALILISSALLAFEDVTDPDAMINVILTYADYGFTAIFTLEVVLKVVNYGLVLHPGAYCRDSWNCVDLLVVCCALTSIVLSINKNASKSAKQVVKILRILRVMRPLKSINKLPKLKAVFQCMIFSLKNVFLVLMITFQFLLIFSIMGVQIFSGAYWYCTDPSIDEEDDCKGTFITFDNENYNEPNENTRDWKVYDFNFENTINAMITLFTSSTGDGWYIHMQRGMDSRGEHLSPLKNNKVWVSVYFIIFVIIFSFFFINVFVGMIILTFQEQGAAESGKYLDRNAKNSLIFAMTSKPMERFMPIDVKSWQYTAWALIESNPWEMAIMLLIILNTFVMLIEFHDEPDYYSNFMAQINTVFSFVFVFEFGVKFFALGCNYFKDFWNVFDLIIVLGGLIDFCIKKFVPPQDVKFDTSIFRLFRAMRLIKLLRRSRSLRILLWTFLKSFQALPYVGMLIFLLFFVYAIIGMQIFSQIAIDSKDDPWAQINENNHFRSYFSATQVLFRIATGENWPNIMLACTAPALCDKTMKSVEPDAVTCGTFLAYLYFVSFIFFCSFLMLNLFIAVIMDNFAFLTADSSILGPHHLDEVVTVWSDFDPRASGRIKHTEVCELLKQMLPPVGLGTKCPKVIAYKRLVKMNMTLYKDGTVDYTGTFFALVRTGLEIFTEDANLKSNDQAFRKILKEVFPNITKRTLDLIIPRTPRNASHMTIGKLYSAKLIWENYKNMRKNGQRRKSIYPTDNLPSGSEV